MRAALLSALVMGVTVGHTILGRIDAIRRPAEEIMAGDLSQRVSLSGRDHEFDALAARLNSMPDRIQQLIKGTREVSDNVAHELRNRQEDTGPGLRVTLRFPHRREDQA